MSDFEDKLRKMEFRQLPADLRRQVLAAADDAKATLWTWRDWFWPSPLVWAAMAVVLLGAVALEASYASAIPSQLEVASDTRKRPALTAMHARSELLSELIP